MNIIDHIARWWKHKGKVNVLTTIDETTGKSVFNRTVQVQQRCSPNPPTWLAMGAIGICQATPEIRTCHILDVRDPYGDPNDIKTVVVVSVDDPASQMDRVALKFQDLARDRRDVVDNFFVAPVASWPEVLDKPQYALFMRKDVRGPTSP